MLSTRLRVVVVSLVASLLITWIGAYRYSPMHPVLAAPAWGFVYAFGQFLEMYPDLVLYTGAEAVTNFAIAVNLGLWWLLIAVLLTGWSKRREGRSPQQ